MKRDREGEWEGERQISMYCRYIHARINMDDETGGIIAPRVPFFNYGLPRGVGAFVAMTATRSSQHEAATPSPLAIVVAVAAATS
jgi:hypothetical protein